MPRPRAYVALVALFIAGLAGCTKHSSTPSGDLPDGNTLTTQGAAAMRDVSSTHVSIQIDGNISSLPLRRAEGDLTNAGDAKGQIQLDQFGALVEYDFVLLGDSIYLKGVTGGWQKLPASTASALYDPSAILDPERGIAKLLATATDATTEGTDIIDGKTTYRVSVTLNNAAVASVVPGVFGSATGKVWLDAGSKQLRRAVLAVTSASPGSATGTVTVNLTDIDKPVSISAP
jgi:lipoprotein LprG